MLTVMIYLNFEIKFQDFIKDDTEMNIIIFCLLLYLCKKSKKTLFQDSYIKAPGEFQYIINQKFILCYSQSAP